MQDKKLLYVIRHAKSSWKNPNLDDIDRPLNKRGLRDAPIMGQYLKTQSAHIQLMLTSPALRAQKTAEIIQAQLADAVSDLQTEDRLYNFTVNPVLKVITSLDPAYETAAIVGHNPALTELINLLTTASIDNLPTCGIATLLLKSNTWRDLNNKNCTLLSCDYPKKLRAC